MDGKEHWVGITDMIKAGAAEAIKQLYGTEVNQDMLQVGPTKLEFDGDYTLVVFGLAKLFKKSPESLGNEIGDHMSKNSPDLFSGYNVIKGFLNLEIADTFWYRFLYKTLSSGCSTYGFSKEKKEKVMVEYSSPNTNKPLHLGHLRNNFLGWSIAEILKANGHEVVKTCIVNDRGIHICKSMVAWQWFAKGETPISAHVKGDHFVGKYYVIYNDRLKQEIQALLDKGMQKEEAERQAPIHLAAQKMLRDWEAGDEEVLALWQTMNAWVYDGFNHTYAKIGSDFDRTYYESQTYLLGKDLIDKGLSEKVFFQKDDGSVWIDLVPDGLDEKIVRRRDGTSVYITQDIGLAVDKYNEYGCGKSIYVVGDEQNYHFKVLKLICQKLKIPAADGIHHLSYGMVELPTGKMKSREGTVVDADDIIGHMEIIAARKTEELGKVKDFSENELSELYETIGLGALKFFLLKVDPQKKMVFNSEESIEFQGFTGPFIQFIHARIKSILRKRGPTSYDSIESFADVSFVSYTLHPLEKSILKLLEHFPEVLKEAGDLHDPSQVAMYAYSVAKAFSSFYSADLSIVNDKDEMARAVRFHLATVTAHVLKTSMNLLGIQVPERM